MRYFKDVRGNFTGVRNNVPRTVIGISQPVVENLSQLWVNNEQRELGKHPIQKIFPDQMGIELGAMRDYAHRQGQSDVADAYDEALAAVRPVRLSKSGISAGALEQDPVHTEIVSQTRAIFGR